MHNIEMESHISTHVEAPSHFIPARYGSTAHDVSEIPLAKFFGTAILVDCKQISPRTPIGPELLSGFDIWEDDIVLIGKCQHAGEDRGYMIKEGVEYLLSRKIKMIGFDDSVYPENPHIVPLKLETYSTHDLMLSNEIPLVEGLANLESLKQTRFTFFGFPAKMGGLDSFPIRAVAFELED